MSLQQDDSTAVSVASALISSCLHQLNSILYGTPLINTAHLQWIHRAAAWVVLYQYFRISPLSSDELLKQLHWLPIEWCIRIKLVTLTFKALHTGHPPYLSDVLQYHESTKSLRSSSHHHLSVPHHNLTFGSRAFRFFAQEFRIHYLSVSVNLSHFLLLDVVYRHFIFSQPIPFSYPPCVEYLRPRALILLRLRRYTNHVLT